MSKKNDYDCEKCLFKCSKLSEYKRHCQTMKHLGIVKTHKCEFCSYSSMNSKDYKKHCETLKHKNQLLNILEENKELKHLLLQQQEQLKEQREKHYNEIINIIPKIGSNNNNKFNLNVFLNEECKDAINWEEFIERLQVTMGDLNNSSITDNITKMICDEIQELGIYKRPIHCVDTKRKKLCIKQENIWEQDPHKVENAIKSTTKHIQQKYVKLLQKWEETHPKWFENESETEMYTILVSRLVSDINEPKCVNDITKILTIPKE